MSAPKTMYMHTLDGNPASFEWIRERQGDKIVHRGYVFFVSRRTRAKLVPSLRRLRYEQRRAQQDTRASHWADASHYGYVLVEVPSR